MSAPTHLGRYQLRYRIAVGGMGGVYLAKATAAGGADKVVAVKLLHEHLAADEAVVSMFLDEARIVSAINHVNVSTVFDFGEQEGSYFLVMEYLEGEALDRVLKSHLSGVEAHPLHPWLVARVLADAAEGLHAAHETKNADGAPLDVVHRDVSPHNIFVTYDGVTKVVDFGIARARERSTATDAGQFKGKFEYASPEQIRGKAVDRRADVWAMGVCLWELLTTTRLFQRDDSSASGRAVLDDAITPPSRVSARCPPEFDAVVMKALERDPAKRYQTAREFGRALRELIARSGEAVDAPLVGEWLEELFPGDRAKRQSLVSAVRKSGPDAPLESVPAELKVKGTGTGSRSYRTGSSSGQRNTLREQSNPGRPDPERQVSTVVGAASSATAAKRGSSLPLIGVGGGLLVITAGALGWAVLRDETDAPAHPLVEESVPPRAPPTKVVIAPIVIPVPPPAAPIPDVDAGVAPVEAVDAGPDPDAGAEPVDAGLPPPLPAVAVAKPTPKPKLAITPPAPTPTAPQPKPVETVVKGKGDGRVRFKTPGATAEVVIDGKVMGTTPLTLDLPAGAHTFELKARGFDFGGPQQLRVSVGGDYNVEIDMR